MTSTLSSSLLLLARVRRSSAEAAFERARAAVAAAREAVLTGAAQLEEIKRRLRQGDVSGPLDAPSREARLERLQSLWRAADARHAVARERLNATLEEEHDARACFAQAEQRVLRLEEAARLQALDHSRRQTRRQDARAQEDHAARGMSTRIGNSPWL